MILKVEDIGRYFRKINVIKRFMYIKKN